MASICSIIMGTLIWRPAQTQVRTMQSVKKRYKKPMHIMRAKLMKLTEHQEPVETRPMAETCTRHLKSLEQKTESPIETFYAKLCHRTIDSSKLVAVFHNEGLDYETMTRFRQRLIKHDMHVKFWGARILREAIMDSKYRHLDDLTHRFNIYVTCDEPRVKELMQAAKRVGRIHLLGGLVEDQLMSPKQMQEYSLLPSLEVARGQLSGILSSATGKTHALLQRNQQMLAMSLEQLAKGNVNGDSSEEATEKGNESEV